MMKRRNIIGVKGQMLTAVRHLAPLFLLLFLLASCKREPLELYYSGKATITVEMDWLSKFGHRPSGMTVIVSKIDSDDIIQSFPDVTNDVDIYEMELEPGTYKMLVFNLSFTEFGSMRFAQTKNFSEIFSFLNQLDRTTDFWDVNANYKREPEAIGCAVDTFTVLPSMADGQPRFIYYKDKMPTFTEKLTLHEVIEPMTTELYVCVKVFGIKYMGSVIGNITGMADGFLLSQAWRRSATCDHLLEKWRISRVDTTANVGFLTTSIRTFGLPRGRELISQRSASSNMLSLCFTLIDNTKHVFRYPVGKHIKYRITDQNGKVIDLDGELSGNFAKANVTLELNLQLEAPFFKDDEVPNLPYAQPTGTGAFDAEVADWGDDEIIDIPM